MSSHYSSAVRIYFFNYYVPHKHTRSISWPHACLRPWSHWQGLTGKSAEPGHYGKSIRDRQAARTNEPAAV